VGKISEDRTIIRNTLTQFMYTELIIMLGIVDLLTQESNRRELRVL